MIPHSLQLLLCLLGLILFLIFVNDLPDVLSDNVLLFTDDVRLIAARSPYGEWHQNVEAAFQWSANYDLPQSICTFPSADLPLPLLLFPMKLYLALVRPILEYGQQASSSYQRRGINLLERAQRLATRMLKGMKELPYEDRLRRIYFLSSVADFAKISS